MRRDIRVEADALMPGCAGCMDNEGLKMLREMTAIAADRGGACVRLLDPMMTWHEDPGSLFEMRCERDHRFAASIHVLQAGGWCPVCENELAAAEATLRHAEEGDDETALEKALDAAAAARVAEDKLHRARNRLTELIQQQLLQRRLDALGVRDVVAYPHEFLCPITCETMVYPVVASDGHSYEHSAIDRVLRGSGVSPLTRETLCRRVFPNKALEKRILAYHAELLQVAEKVTEVATRAERERAARELLEAALPPVATMVGGKRPARGGMAPSRQVPPANSPTRGEASSSSSSSRAPKRAKRR